MQIINKFYKLLNVYIYFILFSLLIVFFSTTYSNANGFKVSNIEISSPFELNFEKNNVIDKGFQTSFSDLISMITTSGDRKKIKNVPNKELKGMIDSFTISDEKFINNEYFANLETTFNKKKILKFLENKNIFPSISLLQVTSTVESVTIGPLISLILISLLPTHKLSSVTVTSYNPAPILSRRAAFPITPGTAPKSVQL